MYNSHVIISLFLPGGGGGTASLCLLPGRAVTVGSALCLSRAQPHGITIQNIILQLQFLGVGLYYLHLTDLRF